jgi:MoxR-like ATPase
MALLSFKQVLGPIKISLESNAVPIIVGDRGIGKTSIARFIAKEMGWKFAHIDGNLLKEGEVGGLPTVVERGAGEIDFEKYCEALVKKASQVKESDFGKLFKMFVKKHQETRNISSQKRLVTAYATFHVLDKVMTWYEKDPAQHILLFIDEINRCEHAVQQELMNLILNREINGLALPEVVHIMAAANPSNKFSDFKNTTYQTVDMDEAQEDRLRWFFIGSDEKVWLDWASTITDEESGETIIDPEISEFIASNPDVLNQPNSTDDIKPSPRSWERVSDAYKVWKRSKGRYTKNDLYNTARGDLGPTVALQFTQFIQENANPMVKPEEIFEQNKDDKLPDNLRKRIKIESHPRMLMTVKNALRYLVRNKKTAKNLQLYTELVQILPKDLMVMVMMTTLNEHREVHNKLVTLDEYLDAFHNIDALVG